MSNLPTSASRPFMRLPACNVSGELGQPLDEWSALIMDRGDLAQNDSLLFDTLDLIAERDLPNVCVGLAGIGPAGRGSPQRDFVVIAQQKMEKHFEAVVSLRIVPKGAKDLAVSWQVFVRNLTAQKIVKGFRIYRLAIAIGLVIFSCYLTTQNGGNFALFCCLPLALFFFLEGFGITSVLANTPLSWESIFGRDRSEQGREFAEADAVALAQQVDYCLRRAMEAHGVDQGQVRVVKRSALSISGNP